MSNVRKHMGQCACGAVRFEVAGDPVRVSVCHCTACQRRTGSAFGVGCYFPEENVTVLGGAMRTFERMSDAGRWIRYRFCEDCGTTVLWRGEVIPGLMGVAAGSFEETDWLAPELHVWAQSAQKWVPFPDGAEVLQQSNLGQT